MNRFFTLFLVTVFINFSHAQEQFSLDIDISGFEDLKGKLYLSLHRSETDFDTDTAIEVHKKIVAVTAPSLVVPFKNLTAGFYAVKIFHDANNNSSLDKNMLGIPKEKYGFSNNAMGTFGPPNFSQAKFLVDKNTRHQILLR